MPAEIVEFLRSLSARATTVTPTREIEIYRDPDDDLILETAMLGEAKYIVNWDDDVKHDLDLVAQMKAHGVTVLSVQQSLEEISSGP